jgi:hypothetical protein
MRHPSIIAATAKVTRNMLALTRWLIEHTDIPKQDIPSAADLPAVKRPKLPVMPPSSAAARMRKTRERAKNGKAIFRIECDHDMIVLALLESRRLTEAEALDRRNVEREIGLLVEDVARKWLR